MEEKEWRVKPYYKTELAQAYVPFLSQKAALNRLADWIKKNSLLWNALQETGYRTRQHTFTSRQVALIFEHLGEP